MGLFRRTAAPEIDVEQLAKAVAAAMPAAPEVAPPMPREDFGFGLPFNPGVPLVPYSIDPRESASGRPAPRRSEFQVAVNMQLTPQRMVPFPILRSAAERVDVIRRCIEVRKSQMLALDWDIMLTRQSIRRIMLQDNISTPGEAARVARERFTADMVRLRDWWEKPDAFNGQSFSVWLGLLLEEQLVTDAVSIWPRPQGNGEIVSLEILDGSTIKPLLDYRGSTPVSPNPAFQQVLYGFPRGEFTASHSQTPDAYRADQLIYRPRYVRSWTPYGCPNTEQALAAADIYLKRMDWIRGEFTDGTTPDTWLKTPADTAKMNPDNIRAWEAAINAELAGQDAERRHLRMLPPGYTPEAMANFAEKYNAEMDEFFIKLLCMSFDVMPTEIGFAPNKGLGGKGNQEGEANSAFRKAVRPTAVWIGDLLTDISRQYLGMPAELEFKLLGYEVEDQNTEDLVEDMQVKGGRSTINESRTRRGLTLFDFPEADQPFLVTGSGLVFLNGAIAAQAASAAASAVPPAAGAPIADAGGPDGAQGAEPTSATDPRPPTNDPTDDVVEEGDPIAEGEPVPDGFVAVRGHLRRKPGQVAEEAVKFQSFARRRQGRTWRDFEFEHMDRQHAAELNKMGAAGQFESIKLVVAALGKANPGE